MVGGVLLKGRCRLHGKEFANDKQERKEQTAVQKFTPPPLVMVSEFHGFSPGTF